MIEDVFQAAIDILAEGGSAAMSTIISSKGSLPMSEKSKMLVTPEGKMEPRPVKVVGQKGTNWIITEGLKAGDKVIVEGTMLAAMSGAQKVQPKEWTPPQTQKPAAAASAPAQAAATSEVQAASATPAVPKVQAASSASAASAAK